jgi:hypothetical protein
MEPISFERRNSGEVLAEKISAFSEEKREIVTRGPLFKS